MVMWGGQCAIRNIFDIFYLRRSGKEGVLEVLKNNGWEFEVIGEFSQCGGVEVVAEV